MEYGLFYLQYHLMYSLFCNHIVEDLVGLTLRLEKFSKRKESSGMTIILCYVMLCYLIFWAKYHAIYKIYEQNLMIRYALCYALLCWLMISLWKWAKSYALLCSAYDDMICYAGTLLFVCKILGSLMRLTMSMLKTMN